VFFIGCDFLPKQNKSVTGIETKDKKVCDSMGVDVELLKRIREFSDGKIEPFHYSLARAISDSNELQINPIHLKGITIGIKNADSYNTIFSLKDEFKKKGYTIFMLENNNSVNDKPDRVGIFKTTDNYKILRDIKTSAFNYDIDNDSLIHIIERWDKDLDLELIGASGDYCEFLINKDPQNWRELAQQIYNICPDVVNQGTGYLVVYKNEMMKNKRLYLWWD
jgi:hypothetical protein